jgi:lysophospholipase L1-like esterase
MMESNLQLEKVDGISSTATEYEEYQKTLNEDLCPTNAVKNYFQNKTILFDGDSITYGTGLTPITNAYPYLVGKELKAKVVNRAVGGSAVGISTIQSVGNSAFKPSLLARYPFIIANYPEALSRVGVTTDSEGNYYDNNGDLIEVPDADIVYIAIGSNDWAYSYVEVGTMEDNADNVDENGNSRATPHTFYGALHLLCRGLISRYIGKQIIFATPIKRRMNQSHTIPTAITKNDKTLKEYCEIIKEVCDYYSIPVIDMYSECGLTPHIDEQVSMFFCKNTSGIQDYVHPNADGHKVMARRIIGYLRGIAG